ncbi:MAG: SulP family inorganic anion transporter [Acidobacteria bacterium]|nr:SulP family inorganic anion transporter [Acidobacteriota bacterium]
MNSSDLRADVLAGATVALVAVPQCLAYSSMAGLPPAYGLATAIVPALVAALAGRSPTVVTGPTNTTSLLILGVVLPFLGPRGLAPEALQWVATLTLLCGVLRIVVAYGGGAVLIRFLPESVLAGFIVGAGILIGLMQMDEALGLPAVSAAGAWAELRGLAATWAMSPGPSPLAIGVAVVSAAAVAIGQRVSPRLPVALAVVAGGALMAWILGLDASRGLPLVSDRAAVPSGWPPGAMPSFDLNVIGQLLLPAAAIVLLGTLELIVTIRAEDPRADLRREIAAQGLANAAGAFASAFPASASLTRSVLLRMGRPSSRAAAAMAALLTLPVLLFGSGMIAHIPQASLSGVLFVIATAMVRQPALGRMWNASGVSRLLLVTTLVSTLVLPLAWAVFVGAGLGLVIHLVRTSTPRVRALSFKEDRLVPVEEGPDQSVVVLEISGAVHYAAAEPLIDQLQQQLPSAARLVIVDLSHAHEFRFTGLRALEWWAADLTRRGIEVRLAGVTPEVRDLLQGAESHLAYTMWDPEPGRSAWNSFHEAGRAGGT